MKYSFRFNYDQRGHGELELLQYDISERYWAARSGSVNQHGNLVNVIPEGLWSIKEPTVWTDESAMVVNGMGWKVRLFDSNGNWTHYLIHPDGGLPGSEGCIVLIGTIGIPLKEMIDRVIKEQQEIKVDVRRK